jgi:hypothetical protein
VSRDELVELAQRWSRAEGLPVRVVFDGPAPAGAVGTEEESADDRIACEAATLAGRGNPYWLVTSDRGLRRRAGRAAENVIGGGAFVRKLRSLPD